MLVLSRKLGERIVLPSSEIEITVLAVNGKSVRLGISAPASLGIYREEVWRRDCEATRQAPSKG
jgi:carbon storage regulator